MICKKALQFVMLCSSIYYVQMLDESIKDDIVTSSSADNVTDRDSTIFPVNSSVLGELEETTSLQLEDSCKNVDDELEAKSRSKCNESSESFQSKSYSNPFANGTVSKTTFEKMSSIIAYMGVCTSIVGSFWNIIGIIVYARMARSPTNTYLIGLTILDIFYLICTITPFSMFIALDGRTLTNKFYLYYAKYISSGIMPCLRKSIVCVTMMLCLERLLAMALPFKARHCRLVKYPKAYIFGSFVIAMIFHTHNFFKINIVDLCNPRFNITVPSMVKTSFSNNYHQAITVFGYVSSGLFLYFPLFVILVSNVCLVVVLQRYNVEGRNNTVSGDKPSQFYALERQKAILILTYTFLFVILTLPYALHVVLQSFIPDFNMGKKEQYLYLIMQRVYALLDIFSSSINFLVYVAMSSAFRRQLVVLLRLQKKKRNKERTDTESTGLGHI